MGGKIEFRGCYVAVVTPFKGDGSLDEAGLRANIDFLAANGVAGVVPCGTTGESATLSWDEHKRVIEIAIEQAAGRIQVVAGAGSNNTAEAIEASKFAKKAGADAIMTITPYYNKPSQEGLYRHFKAIAEVDIPMLVYNVPGRTGVNMLPETVERLCDIPQVAAVKEASGNITQISDIHRRVAGRITVLSGDDGMTLPVMACGGAGIVSVIGNIVPAKMSRMVDLYLKGDHAGALKLHEELLPLSQIVFIDTNPVPVKACMNEMGLAAGPVRLPLAPLSDATMDKLMAVWKTYR
ncbi:MAG: 4-hydroxy-tetrahydrodipicolinate synthase [Chitinispirillia bacterium]|nr:4-hydroxy-tetrahydrodipicolinate synthase [Chitinispirillia bacterium]MCL2269211.1 4-hydroxy-tetrahydrodipicolinate synthase [Chitinispirillia bacterium]